MLPPYMFKCDMRAKEEAMLAPTIGRKAAAGQDGLLLAQA